MLYKRIDYAYATTLAANALSEWLEGFLSLRFDGVRDVTLALTPLAAPPIQVECAIVHMRYEGDQATLSLPLSRLHTDCRDGDMGGNMRQGMSEEAKVATRIAWYAAKHAKGKKPEFDDEDRSRLGMYL